MLDSINIIYAAILRHSAAQFAQACAHTFLALFIIVLLTFCCTGFTQFSPNAADFLSIATAETHQLCGCMTKGCTFHIQLNAFCHHPYTYSWVHREAQWLQRAAQRKQAPIHVL